MILELVTSGVQQLALFRTHAMILELVTSGGQQLALFRTHAMCHSRELLYHKLNRDNFDHSFHIWFTLFLLLICI